MERGKKMKSQLTVLTSIRRSSTLPGILRRTSSLLLPQTICSCSRRITNNIHISSFFTTPQFHTVLSGGEEHQDFNKPQTLGNFSDLMPLDDSGRNPQSGQARTVRAIRAILLSQKWKENIFLQFL